MVRHIPYSFCDACGTRREYSPEGSVRLPCSACGYVRFLNPAPIALVIVPYNRGIVLIRRGTESDGKKKLALPGGYVEVGESWCHAGAREVREETGIAISAEGIALHLLESTPDKKHLLCFGVAYPVHVLPRFTPSAEVLERLFVLPEEWHIRRCEMAFPLHVKAVDLYFGDHAP